MKTSSSSLGKAIFWFLLVALLAGFVFLVGPIVMVAEVTRVTLTPSPSVPAPSPIMIASFTPTRPGLLPSPTQSPEPILLIVTGLPEGTVNLRSGPSMEASVLMVLSEGNTLYFQRASGEWDYVCLSHQSLCGYVYSAYLH